MQTRHAFLTDVGRRREHNEDSLFVDGEARLWVVADGMGGHAAGETASRLTVDALARVLCSEQAVAVPAVEEVPAAAMARAIAVANEAVLSAARRDRRLAGMGTTVVGLLARGAEAFIGHVGDSRAYLLRSGTLALLTEDHSLVQEQVRAGVLTPELARVSPYRNVITRSVGMEEEVEVDLARLTPCAGDRLLLCSDGLNGMLEDAEIGALLGAGTIDEAARLLVDRANAAGGDDNITVVIVEWFE
ncbi:MAG: hypothetical protein RL199_1129 [Pseudomonadota bacterium]|jgi:protein phosphatase